MALKIVRSNEPITIEQIVMVIYGPPGLGKSTLGFSAESPLTLDFDKGAYRAANRGDSVQMESWTDVTSITENDLKPYKTIIIDTAGRALDFLTTDIIKRNPKMGYGGSLTLQGYGVLKGNFTDWLKLMRSFRKDVVLIAHSSEDKKGDEIIERLDIQGGSKGEIYKSADAMGHLMLVSRQRILNFSPTDTAFGKNPASLPPLEVPEIATDPTFLSGVIDTIKSKLNSLTEEQKARQDEIAKWMQKFEKAKTAKDFNDLVPSVKSADSSICPIIKAELHKRAKASGFIYENNGYVGVAK